MTAQSSPHHHPCCNTLLRYAAGSLSPAMHLFVASHLSYCPQCRQELQSYEAQAGLGLEALPPEALDHHCLENLLSKIDETGPPLCIDVTIPLPAPDHHYPDPLLPHVGTMGEQVRWDKQQNYAQWILPTLPSARLLKISGGTELHLLSMATSSMLLVLDGDIETSKSHFYHGDIVKTPSTAKTASDVVCLVIVPACSDKPNWWQCLLAFIFGDKK
ncbi:MAG: hypothetical protein EB059_06305 [Alphaproteobacteria bacterium]|nr:hypothetical protein [Alphaproteobacteria bacterium]